MGKKMDNAIRWFWGGLTAVAVIFFPLQVLALCALALISALIVAMVEFP